MFECYHGDKNHGIMDLIERSGCDMVVMGTRGHGTIKRKLLGSASKYVLDHAKVPILICP